MSKTSLHLIFACVYITGLKVTQELSKEDRNARKNISLAVKLALLTRCVVWMPSHPWESTLLKGKGRGFDQYHYSRQPGHGVGPIQRIRLLGGKGLILRESL